MILYHRTTAANAEQILRDGFRDGVGTYMTTQEFSGVWLSNVPLDVNEGAEGDTLLQVELPEEDIANYEWIEEGNREFFLNKPYGIGGNRNDRIPTFSEHTLSPVRGTPSEQWIGF